jgi:hypothetical protein
MTDKFLGIPIEGSIIRADKRRTQQPLEEFQPLVVAVLQDPTVVEFGWAQYTPYFNDGDPCVFSADSFWVRLDSDTDDTERWEMEIDGERKEALGRRPLLSWKDGKATYGPFTGSDEERYDRVMALNDAVVGGSFDDALLEAFGDHAEVTLRKDKIIIDTYSHE